MCDLSSCPHLRLFNRKKPIRTQHIHAESEQELAEDWAVVIYFSRFVRQKPRVLYFDMPVSRRTSDARIDARVSVLPIELSAKLQLLCGDRSKRSRQIDVTSLSGKVYLILQNLRPTETVILKASKHFSGIFRIMNVSSHSFV